MVEHSPAGVQRYEKVYRLVVSLLILLTFVTVWASYLDLSVAAAIIIALIIAGVKGSLVASFFMHLAYERRLFFTVLILTLIFFGAMLGLIIGSHHNSVGVQNVP